jgi:hypothetical protein
MASYVFSFSSQSADVANFVEIPVDFSEGNYAQANTGHQAIDISVTSSTTGANQILSLVWADCDQNKANSVLGVSKVDTITCAPGARRTNLSNAASDNYVCSVSAASSSSSIVRTIGIGPVIDLRSSPVNLPRRRLLLGCTTLSGTVVVIVTPTKIL